MTAHADSSTTTPRFDRQVALVTGASRGLGRAFAQALAASGAAAAVSARSAAGVRATAEEIQAQGRRAVAYELDVTDPSAVAQVVAAVEHDLGPVDLLVNNAGVMAPMGPDWLVDRAAWWRTFSGWADALSGCHIADTDLPDLLLQNVDMVRQQELYVLCIRSLPAEN